MIKMNLDFDFDLKNGCKTLKSGLKQFVQKSDTLKNQVKIKLRGPKGQIRQDDMINPLDNRIQDEWETRKAKKM